MRDVYFISHLSDTLRPLPPRATRYSIRSFLQRLVLLLLLFSIPKLLRRTDRLPLNETLRWDKFGNPCHQFSGSPFSNQQNFALESGTMGTNCFRNCANSIEMIIYTLLLLPPRKDPNEAPPYRFTQEAAEEHQWRRTLSLSFFFSLPLCCCT